MRAIVRRPAQTLALAMAALLIVGSLAADVAEAAGPQQRLERRLLNGERRDKGRPKVRFHRRLNKIARRHSVRMARADRLHHSTDLVSRVRGMRWRRLGENVGVAPRMGARTLKVLHKAFMESLSHRKNILLRPFRRVGVGIARRDGKVWVTVVFMG